jgi:hypothetical protein
VRRSSNPEQTPTGSEGYARKRASACARAQRQKTEPFALPRTRAKRQAEQSPTRGSRKRGDGSLHLWHGEHELLATAFPKEHRVQQGKVVENKRLAVALDFIKDQQRERIEAKVAKPSTTRRDARLLRAGTPRRAAMGSSAETRP